MSEARGGWSETARRLLAAWPLTLGVAVLSLLLIAGALTWMTRRPTASAALSTTPSVAVAPPALDPAPPVAAMQPALAPPIADTAAPTAVAEAASPGTEAAAAPTLAGMAGEWTAEDADTRSLTRVAIRAEGDEAFVHVWGRCHPSDCDWGEAGADADLDRPKPRLSVIYEPGFATEALSLRLVRPGLIAYRLETEFTDGSGRGSQVSEGLMQHKSR